MDALRRRLMRGLRVYPQLREAFERGKKPFSDAFIALLTSDKEFTRIMAIDDLIRTPEVSRRQFLGFVGNAAVAGVAYGILSGEAHSQEQSASTPTGTKGTISIQDYYASATPVDEFGLKGLRVQPIVRDSTARDITSRLGAQIGFRKPGEFSSYFFSDKYGPAIKQIFDEGGTNPSLLAALLRKQSGREIVSLYRDGYMILFSDKSYVLPIGNQVADKVNKL